MHDIVMCFVDKFDKFTSILYVNQSMKYWLLIETIILIYDLHFDLPLWKAIIIYTFMLYY